jgi:23S rRNA (cytosine1962-C5)-methyltransferase
LLVSELSEGKKVLDCFCYTGGFSLAALLGGAKKVCAVDSSVDSLKMAEENVLLNGFDDSRIEFKEENVFYYLRELRDKGEQFDLIIVDPPKFAPTSAQVQKASRGYKDINLLALKLLVPNGLLITFSCSGGVDSLLFQKIIAGAAVDAKVEAQILTRLWQAPDHPIRLSFPEGEYLKGLVLQVLEN